MTLQTNGGPVLQKYNSSGVLLATYYLPFAETNELAFEKEGEVFKLVDSLVVRTEVLFGFLPKLTVKWPIYNDVIGNIGTATGQTPAFLDLLQLLSLPSGQLKVAQNENSTFFTCLVTTIPTIDRVRQRFARNVEVVFQGTTLYKTASLDVPWS